jgi:hypothetical protein
MIARGRSSHVLMWSTLNEKAAAGVSDSLNLFVVGAGVT